MTKKFIAALSSAAILLSAAGCGNNEDAKLGPNGKLSENTQYAGDTYTPGPVPAATSAPSADYATAEQTSAPEQQYSTPEVPTDVVTWTQGYSFKTDVVGHTGGGNGNESTTLPASDPGSCYTPVSPDDRYDAIDAEYQACGGVTSFVRLGKPVLYNGVLYGLFTKELPTAPYAAQNYGYTLYSIDENNNCRILQEWEKKTTPTGASSGSVNFYFCNGMFYADYYFGFGKSDILYYYDIEGDLLGSYTLPLYNPERDIRPSYVGRFSASIETICPDGKLLTSHTIDEDWNNNYHYELYIDEEKVPEPTPAGYGDSDTFYPKHPWAVTGMYKNKVYMSFEEYSMVYSFWLDTDTLQWHELPDDIHLESYLSDSLNPFSDNYAVGRYLFTDDMVYDMEEDKVLFTSAEDERGVLSFKKYLYGDRNVVADAEGVTVYPAGGGDGVKVLEWD